MDEDVKTARRMMARLSDLLRQTLDNIGVQEVPFRQEIEFLKTYLEIEQTRFQDRLTVEFDIDEHTLDALVPNLILQPLIENAIKHGILPRPEGGYIEIAAQQKDDRLILEVNDDGVGIPDQNSDRIKEGLGISSTKKRLQTLYGAQHRIEIKNRENGGLVVHLSLPLKIK